jgi:hypothetical protein
MQDFYTLIARYLAAVPTAGPRKKTAAQMMRSAEQQAVALLTKLDPPS